jgi:hypothetical protein
MARELHPTRAPARSNPEAKLHASIIDYLRLVAPTCLCFHPANGGNRTASEGAMFQRLGVVAGIPDICILSPGGKVAFIEVKAASGALSKAQDAILSRFMTMGIPYAAARSVDDVKTALEYWRIPTREARAEGQVPRAT